MTRVLCLFRDLLMYTVLVLGGFTLVILAGVRMTDISLFVTYGNVMSMFCVIFPAILVSNAWLTANLAMSFGARRGDCFWSLELVGFLLTVFFAADNLLLTNLSDSPEVAQIGLETVPVLVIPAFALVQTILFMMQIPKGRIARNVVWGVSWCLGWAIGMAIEAVYLLEAVPPFFYPVALTTPLWAILCLIFAVPGIVFAVLAWRNMKKVVVQL